MTTIQLLLTGTAATSFVMFVLWLLQQRTQNAGYVDIGWTYNLGLLGLLYGARGTSPALPRWTLAIMVTLWSLRLGTHILVRVVGKPEEGRYKQLRQHWNEGTGWKFLLFFLGQALLDVMLSIPFVLVAIDTSGPVSFNAIHFIAIALFTLAIAGEAIADAQLASFKKTAQKGGVCQVGLWKYSRHPNYFFEWLTWIAYAIFATQSHLGWLAWSAPALMLLFLFKVTGIPYTEAQSVRSKGEAYREYQRTTSVFIPWPRKGATS